VAVSTGAQAIAVRRPPQLESANGLWRATPDEDEHYIYAIAL